jgi:fatty acid-binding protein DegV
LSEGEIRPAERCKTKGQALEALFNIVRKRSGGNKLHVFINHSDVPAEAEELKAKALSQFSCSEVYIAPIGPVVTVHVGLGVRLFQWWSEG